MSASAPGPAGAWKSRGEIAFAIVDGENHASVALKDRGPKNPHTLELIRAALEVEDADYRSSGASFPWQRRVDQLDRHRAPLARY